MLIVVVLIAWIGWISIRRLKKWRSELKDQKLLLEEKDKEIMELQSLWKVSPASIEWLQLLSKLVALILPMYIKLSPDQEIYRGGYGEVWKCKMGETEVAVKKLLSYWLMTDSSTAVEFEREAEILKKLRHPNIVLFFGAGNSIRSIIIFKLSIT